MLKHVPIRLLFIAMVLAATGCASSPGAQTYPSWQQGVERYVRDFGKGDPTSLRDMKIADGRNGFALLGSPLPKESTDAVGVLVGHRAIAGRPTFVYLVGLVDQGKVSDIRVALLSVQGGQFHWSLSPANASALQAYRKHKDAQWRERFPHRTAEPADYANFPGADDVFTLDTSGGRITVADPASGAVWTASPVTDGRVSMN